MTDGDRLIDGGQGPGRADVPGAPWGAPPGSNNSGGPRTPSGLARVTRNLGDPGRANLRHGGYAWLHRGVAPMCDSCEDSEECEYHEIGRRCQIAIEGHAELTRTVMALDHVKPEAEVIVRDYATWVVLLWIANREVARSGLFVGEGSKRRQAAGVELQHRASTRVQALANELGLTPASQVRLRLSQQGGVGMALMAAVMEAEELRQQEQARRDAETVDGQFELELGEGDGGEGNGGEGSWETAGTAERETAGDDGDGE